MFTFRRCVWSDVVSNEILFFFFFSVELGFLPAGGRRSPRWITLTRLRLVRSRTQTHSANCRLVLHTPDQKPQAGWLWLRWSEKAQRSTKANSNTKTLWSTHKFTSTLQDKQKHRLPHLGLKSCLLSSNKWFIHTNFSEWNGGKPKMEALAEVSEGHDHTAL